MAVSNPRPGGACRSRCAARGCLSAPMRIGAGRPSRCRSAGFTLVELLVVITIIGILMSLLLPAVQSARESARLMQCQNNVRQLALGALNHESAKGYFPTGGWGSSYTGDPDLGTGYNQPGGWMYCILPYIEQTALSRVGAGLAGTPSGGAGTAKAEALTKLITTPLAAFYCPTRRAVALYAFSSSHASTQTNCAEPANNLVIRNDYAACAGDNGYTDSAVAGTITPSSSQLNTGVCIQRSQLPMVAVKDGASNTYLLGEKYLNPDDYTNGWSYGDNEHAFTGYNYDQTRTSGNSSIGYKPPVQDTPGWDNYFVFGSAHPTVFVMALCDGSVRNISFSINPETHRRLANRADGYAIDFESL